MSFSPSPLPRLASVLTSLLVGAAAFAGSTGLWASGPDTDRAAPAPTVAGNWDGTVIQSLTVRDLAKSRDWYMKAFDLEIVLDLSQMGWIELSTPEQTKHSLIGLSQLEEGQRFHNNGSSTLSFGIKNVDAALKRLAGLGVEVTRVDIPETVTLINFEDPDGNHLMLHGPAAK